MLQPEVRERVERNVCQRVWWLCNSGAHARVRPRTAHVRVRAQLEASSATPVSDVGSSDDARQTSLPHSPLRDRGSSACWCARATSRTRKAARCAWSAEEGLGGRDREAGPGIKIPMCTVRVCVGVLSPSLHADARLRVYGYLCARLSLSLSSSLSLYGSRHSPTVIAWESLHYQIR